MAIAALRNRVVKPPVVGRLWKGAKKKPNVPGKDLNTHFRFTSSIPDAEKDFRAIYGDKPNNIPFYFPFDDYEMNFYTACEAYTTSRLQHRCDGEYVELWYNKENGKYTQPSYGTMKCPGGCGWVARMSLVLPAFLEKHAGVVMIELHGFNDILELDAQLKFHHDIRGTLKGMPFVVHRYPKMISTPKHGRQEKWLVGIRPDTKLMTMLIQEPQGAPMLAVDATMQLESGVMVDEDGVVINEEEPIEAEIVENEPVTQAKPVQRTPQPKRAVQPTTGGNQYADFARAGNWAKAIEGIPRYAGNFPSFMGATEKLVRGGINNQALTRGEDAPQLRVELFQAMKIYAEARDKNAREYDALKKAHVFFGDISGGLGDILKPIATDNFDDIPSASAGTRKRAEQDYKQPQLMGKGATQDYTNALTEG